MSRPDTIQTELLFGVGAVAIIRGFLSWCPRHYAAGSMAPQRHSEAALALQARHYGVTTQCTHLTRPGSVPVLLRRQGSQPCGAAFHLSHTQHGLWGGRCRRRRGGPAHVFLPCCCSCDCVLPAEALPACGLPAQPSYSSVHRGVSPPSCPYVCPALDQLEACAHWMPLFLRSLCTSGISCW